MPDSIAAFTLDGKDYLLFAEEGDDYTYGDFEDKQKPEAASVPRPWTTRHQPGQSPQVQGRD